MDEKHNLADRTDQLFVSEASGLRLATANEIVAASRTAILSLRPKGATMDSPTLVGRFAGQARMTSQRSISSRLA